MSDDRWIVVRNWEKFQHYTNRNPPWIKLYTSLDADDEWRRLTFAQRGVLVSIWCSYARSRGVVSVRSASNLTGRRISFVQLKALRDAGFITILASKPLALTETKKKKKELGANAPRPKPFDARQNATPKDPVKAIRTMIQNGVITDLVDLEAELQGFHLNSNVGDDLRKLLQ